MCIKTSNLKRRLGRSGTCPYKPAATVIFGLIITSVLMSGLVYAETDMEELKRSLKEQEKEMAAQTAQPAFENKGYIVSSPRATTEVRGEVVPPVYVTEEVQTETDELYASAKRLFREGKLEEAKGCLETLIRLNPLHIPARSFLKRILERQKKLASGDSVILGKEQMLEIDRKWIPPKKIKEEEKPKELEVPIKSERLLYMEEKTRQIIPEINFTDAHIRDVLMYLSGVSGINIVIDEDLFPEAGKEDIVPEKVEMAEEGAVEKIEVKEEDVSPISARITISLVNIPLIEALKYILSAKGLTYKLDEYAIVVSTPERLSAVAMETRYYHLTAGPGIFTEFAKKVGEEVEEGTRGITKGLEEKGRITIKDVLEQSGVPFPAGSKVFLDERTGILIVRNTPTNLVLVEEVLRILDIAPFQVEIEARFIEISEESAQELGLEWIIKAPGLFFDNNNYRWDYDVAYDEFGQYIGAPGKQGITRGLRYLGDTSSITNSPRDLTGVGDILKSGGIETIREPRSDVLYELEASEAANPAGNILSISGILTKPQFRMILHALNQSGCANVLSSPKVTTLNNQQAQIEVVKEIIYPTEFELTPATTNDAGTVITQPVVTPSAWNTRDIGVTLNVTPSVGADRRTINLTLSPDVSHLKGWYDYGIEEKKGKWSRIPILQPSFFTKNVATNVVVNDGETVVLGGLIKEDLIVTEDKIPLLGDIPLIGKLFRSETEQSKKTNLLIFVTANLLSPAGERIQK